ncbi:MAG: hypothetical protein AAF639_15330, partial [Chloroflexota bacterium]
MTSNQNQSTNNPSKRNPLFRKKNQSNSPVYPESRSAPLAEAVNPGDQTINPQTENIEQNLATEDVNEGVIVENTSPPASPSSPSRPFPAQPYNQFEQNPINQTPFAQESFSQSQYPQSQYPQSQFPQSSLSQQPFGQVPPPSAHDPHAAMNYSAPTIMAQQHRNLAHPPTQKRRGSWFDFILMTGLLVCLLIGGAALTIFLLLSDDGNNQQFARPLANNPSAADTATAGIFAATISPDLILPQLSLRHLAGDPALALARQALVAGELDTAYALLLFHHSNRIASADLLVPHTLSDDLPSNLVASNTNLNPNTAAASELGGILLQLAQRYQAASRPVMSAHVYYLLSSFAIVEPSLNPLERSQLLTQAAAGLDMGNENLMAANVATQALYVGAQSPDLLPAQRSSIFEGMRPLAQNLSQSLNDTTFQQQVEDFLRNPYIAAETKMISIPWGVLFHPTIINPESVSLIDSQTHSSAATDESILTAIANRQATAHQLAERIAVVYAETGQLIDIEPERQALAQALLIEDQTRNASYQRMLSSTDLSLEQQLRILQAQRTWLLVKIQVAARGFGITLVPNWENDVSSLVQQLNNTTATLDAVLDAYAGTLVSPVDQAMMRASLLHWVAWQLEWGLYTTPNVDEVDRRLRAV